MSCKIQLKPCLRSGFRGLALFVHCCSLREVNLSYCGKLTDADVAPLSQLRLLENLNLRFCVGLTPEGLNSLSSLANLQTLDVTLCMVSPGEPRVCIKVWIGSG